MGILRGYDFFQPESPSYLTESACQANVLIDQSGHACLADFGLLTIVSDPTNHFPSSSYTQGGTARWMSPELIAPRRFGFEDSRPSKPSDCYALGMVIYETVTENLPFHGDIDLTVFMKVVEGERPPRGARFSDDLWNMLELCWAPRPNDRPNIEGVLRCLGVTQNLLEPPSPWMDEGTDEDGDDWDSTTGSSPALNETGGTTTTEWSSASSSGFSYLTNDPPNPVLTTPGPSIVEATGESDVDGLRYASAIPSPLPLPSRHERGPDIPEHPSVTQSYLSSDTSDNLTGPSPPSHFAAQDNHAVRSPPLPRTRTVALIKNHALHHRLDIEPLICEAGFDVRQPPAPTPSRRAESISLRQIVKERQMEFDMVSDPEIMYDLFGEDAVCFTEYVFYRSPSSHLSHCCTPRRGPVRVYVLERRGAVGIWQNLMGDVDPKVARERQPDSLRALYGISTVQNAVTGSPDDETAEIQIASLFAASPPLPVANLPDDGSIRSTDPLVLRAPQESAPSEAGYLSIPPTNPRNLPPVNPPSTTSSHLSLPNRPERSPDLNHEHLSVPQSYLRSDTAGNRAGPSPPTHFVAQDNHAARSPPLPRTRTVAIVKNHALDRRLDIEPRICEAGFDVRQPPHTYPESTR